MHVRRTLMIWAGLLSLLILTGTAQAGQRAPEISSDRWINGAPMTLDSLRGKVVIVDFWTRA